MNVISGCVIGPDRRPIMGASVMFTRGPVSLPDIAQITDRAGKFALAAPMTGIYGLLVNAPGFPPIERQVEVNSNTTSSIEIKVGGHS
jgi:hypothetical protein